MKIVEVERITVDVPFTERVRRWNALLVGQWRVSEITRVVTDTGVVGYGETLPHYTWGNVTDEAVERVRGKNPADFLGDDSLGAGLQMAIYDVVGKALGVPAYRLFNLPKARDWCPIAWWNTKMGPEDLAEEAAVSAVTPPHYRIDVDWNEMLLNVGNAAPVPPRSTGTSASPSTSRHCRTTTLRATASYVARLCARSPSISPMGTARHHSR